jgi:hypothetical protein
MPPNSARLQLDALAGSMKRGPANRALLFPRTELGPGAAVLLRVGITRARKLVVLVRPQGAQALVE